MGGLFGPTRMWVFVSESKEWDNRRPKPRLEHVLLVDLI
jgi:hypothetical protein